MRIPKKAKIPIGIVWALLIGIVFAINAMAGIEGESELKCDCNIEIMGTPELNKPFEAILTWTPRSEVNMSRNIPDTVRLMNGYENMLYISGDTLWIGDLEKDETYSMKAIYSVVDYGYCRVEAMISSSRAKGIVAVPPGSNEYGIHAEKHCRSNRSFLADPNKDTTTALKVDMKWFYTESGDSIGIGEVKFRSNFSIGGTVVVADTFDLAQAKKKQIRGGPAPTDTADYNISISTIIRQHSIALKSGKAFRIYFPKGVKNIEIDSGCVVNFEKIRENIVIIDRPKKECTLNIFLDDSLYLLPIKIVR